MACRHHLAPFGHPYRWLAPLSLLLSLTAFVGCGPSEQVIPDRAIVAGTVTFAGQPLNGGSISFSSENDPALRITTSLRNGGKFRTDRAPIGKSLISIETESVLNGNPSAFVKIPAKYNEPTTSGLSADIKPGNNENVDFALEK